jgi:uncharacterized protein (DUF2235 family)
MAKNIIFCADGTWNGPGQDDDHDGIPDNTNVFKLFCNLDGKGSTATTLLANEQEKALTDATGAVRQVAKYLHGVGDSRNFLVKILGGGGGAGLITRIVRGYTFVSRNYAPNDRIFLLGFSRGAYTVRALAGLIAARGLLDAGAPGHDLEDRENAYRLGSAVWFDYRREALAAAAEPFRLRQLEEVVVGLPGFFRTPPPPQRITDVQIDVVAVWDTVGSLGIPRYTLDATRIDAFRFSDTKLSGIVRRGIHAVALDEQRADFTPTLWTDDPRVIQMLFPGAHSDVGGGYPARDNQSGLADGALRWMMEELSAVQVQFARALPCVPNPDPAGIAHQPWIHSPFDKLPAAVRRFDEPVKLHSSVTARMQSASVVADPGRPAGLYRPTNLP